MMTEKLELGPQSFSIQIPGKHTTKTRSRGREECAILRVQNLRCLLMLLIYDCTGFLIASWASSCRVIGLLSFAAMLGPSSAFHDTGSGGWALSRAAHRLLHGMRSSHSGSNLGPLHQQVESYPLCHQGSPLHVFKVAAIPEKAAIKLATLH